MKGPTVVMNGQVCPVITSRLSYSFKGVVIKSVRICFFLHGYERNKKVSTASLYDKKTTTKTITSQVDQSFRERRRPSPGHDAA